MPPIIPTAAAIQAANARLRPTTRSVKAHPLVRDISVESDGVWIYLHDGWCDPATDANAISEDTLAEAIANLKGAYYDAGTLDS
jgi:hypothetical protein